MPNVNRWKPPQRNGKKPSLRFINQNAQNLPYGWTEPKSKKANRSKRRKRSKSKRGKKAKGIYHSTKVNLKLNRELNRLLKID
jgi:hypothetical protein